MEKLDKQPSRSPEKLLTKVVLPDETIAEVYGNPETNEMEYFFYLDTAGNVLEYTDMRGSKDKRDTLKKHFEERGFSFTAQELNALTQKLFQGKLNQEIDEIDENTATEQ
ncbi:MAG: hypothetical protein AAB598_00065 [Patescibacteria group bacterium]